MLAVEGWQHGYVASIDASMMSFAEKASAPGEVLMDACVRRWPLDQPPSHHAPSRLLYLLAHILPFLIVHTPSLSSSRFNLIIYSAISFHYHHLSYLLFDDCLLL